MKIVLTMAEIRDLALFCGFRVDGNGAETRDAEELETEIAIVDVPHGIKDDDGTERRYAHIAWYDEYPEEGAMGLGPELPNENMKGGVSVFCVLAQPSETNPPKSHASES